MVTGNLLFTPFRVGRLELGNRIVMSPMLTCYATRSGEVTDRMGAYYAERARGGAGLVTVEYATVVPRSNNYLHHLGAWDDRFVPGLSRLVRAIHDGGAPVALQLGHAGRRASARVSGVQPVAPSALAGLGSDMPRELSAAEIEHLVEAFARAAARGVEAGADAVALHMGHGYLVHTFFSPFSNRRADGYGCDLEGRARFGREIARAVRAEVGPEFPVICRISAHEFVEGGLTLEDAVQIAQVLEAAGASLIDVSCGIPESALHTPASPLGDGMEISPGALAPMAAVIRRGLRIPVSVVGRINEPEVAERILREGAADLVTIGRAFLADPNFARKAQAGRVAEITPCIACNQGCRDRMDRHLPITCLTNARAGRERQFPMVPAARRRRVLVVGGGPGGLEAARVAALRGHEVELLERASELGGQLRVCSIPPHKQDIDQLRRYLIAEVGRLGVKVETGCEATPESIMARAPEAVIVAVGPGRELPRILGLDRVGAVVATDLLLGTVEVGASVLVVGGGGAGCETAEYLATRGHRVVVAEALEGLARDLPPTERAALLDRLVAPGVDLLTQATVVALEGRTAVIERAGVRERLFDVDTVVVTGAVPNRGLADALRTRGLAVTAVGDCVAPRSALEAIHEGFEAAYVL